MCWSFPKENSDFLKGIAYDNLLFSEGEMGIYTYSIEKNFKLIRERGISFEEIIAAIENGEVLDVLEHPNEKKYTGQKIYIVRAKGYVYLVPYVVDFNGNIFLKTIIPSRKAKKKYGEKKI